MSPGARNKIMNISGSWGGDGARVSVSVSAWRMERAGRGGREEGNSRLH